MQIDGSGGLKKGCLVIVNILRFRYHILTFHWAAISQGESLPERRGKTF